MDSSLETLQLSELKYLLDCCGSMNESINTLTVKRFFHGGKQTKRSRIDAALLEFRKQRDINECWFRLLDWKLSTHKSKLVDTFTSVELLECLLILDVAAFSTWNTRHRAFRPVLNMMRSKGLFKN